MIEYLEYILILLGFSNLMFVYMITDEIAIIPCVSLSIGLLHSVMPMGSINEKLCEVILYNLIF